MALSHTLATAYFARWWHDVEPVGETVPCRLLPSNTLDAYEALHHGGCDLLLAYIDPAHPLGIDTDEVEWVPVAHDRLSPCSAVSGTQATYPLPPPVGRRVPFLSHGSGAFLGRVTDRALSCGDDLALQPVIQCDLTETLYRLVIAGRGMAWLPGLLTQTAVDEGLIVRVGGARWDVDLEVRLYRRRSSQPGEHARMIWARALQRADDS